MRKKRPFPRSCVEKWDRPSDFGGGGRPTIASQMRTKIELSSDDRRLESNFVDAAIAKYQDGIAEHSFVYLPLWLLPRSA